MSTSRARLFFHIAGSPEVIQRALKLACIVGLLLNFINQGEHLIGLQLSQVNWLKFGITFTVPFCVSAYSAAQIKMSLTPGNRACQHLQLSCTHCDRHRVVVLKERLIPECPNCKSSTVWAPIN